jgi:hypothetical protein
MLRGEGKREEGREMDGYNWMIGGILTNRMILKWY